MVRAALAVRRHCCSPAKVPGLWSPISPQTASRRQPNFANAEGEATAVVADISKSADVSAIMTATLETYGRLDCAFNTAETIARRGTELLATVPFREFGKPEDVAEMVCWLSSDRAHYVSGGSFTVDGA